MHGPTVYAYNPYSGRNIEDVYHEKQQAMPSWWAEVQRDVVQDPPHHDVDP